MARSAGAKACREAMSRAKRQPAAWRSWRRRRWPNSLAADCSDWPDVVRLCEQFTPAVDRDDPRGCYGNALRCAVELSILDAFGRLFGEPVSAVTAHFEPARPILTAARGWFRTARSSTPATRSCGAKRWCGGCTAFATAR